MSLKMAASRVVLLVLGLCVLALAGREEERFRDCSPKNSQIHVTYANILEPRIILGQPVQVEIEGYVDAGVDLTKHTLKIVAKRFSKNSWLEEASFGPISVKEIKGLTGTPDGKFKVSSTAIAPVTWPEGLYMLIATLSDPSGEEVWCFRADEQLFPKSAMSGFNKKAPIQNTRPAFGRREGESKPQPVVNTEWLGETPKTPEELAEFRKRTIDSLPKLMERKKKEYDFLQKEIAERRAREGAGAESKENDRIQKRRGNRQPRGHNKDKSDL